MKTNRVHVKSSPLVRNIILITTVSFAIGTLSFFGVKWWFVEFFRYVSMPLDWGLLGGFTSMISLAVVVGGLTFAGVEYVSRENAKARKSQAVFRYIPGNQQQIDHH